MNSPELLLLVENCPKGAETLVTRCLHSLTDKGGPWPPPLILFLLLFPFPESRDQSCWVLRWLGLLWVSLHPGASVSLSGTVYG